MEELPCSNPLVLSAHVLPSAQSVLDERPVFMLSTIYTYISDMFTCRVDKLAELSLFFRIVDYGSPLVLVRAYEFIHLLLQVFTNPKRIIK